MFRPAGGTVKPAVTLRLGLPTPIRETIPWPIPMSYAAAADRYANPSLYRRCGRTGIKLPMLSLGLWHNFGGDDNYATGRSMVLRCLLYTSRCV